MKHVDYYGWIAGGALAVLLAVPSSAMEMSGGSYRITRDDVNASGEKLTDGASYVLTGSLGGIETRELTGGNNRLTPGLQKIYHYPKAITSVGALPEPTGNSADQLLLSWLSPGAGVLPDTSPLAAKSYIVRFSSVTALTTETAFANAATHAQAIVPAAPGASESLTIPGLMANTSYYVAIESLDGLPGTDLDQSYISNAANACTNANKPSNLQFLAFAPNSINLGWDTNNQRASDTITFDAQIALDAAFSSGVNTFPVQSNSTTQAAYLFTTLFQGVDYHFRVRARNNVGVPTAWCDIPISTQIPAGLPGAQPFTGHDVDRVTANWDRGANGPGVGYQSRLADNIAYLSEQIAPPVPGADLFSAQYTGLLPNTTYFARAQAFPVGGGAPSSFGDLGWTMTGVHRGLAGTYAAHVSSASFAWSAPAVSNGSNRFFYRVEMSTSSSYTGAIFSALVDDTQTAAQVSGLTPNTVYYARLVTLNGVLVPSAQGPSPFAPQATLPVDPLPGSVTLVDDYRIGFDWSHNGNNPTQTRYRVQASSDSSGGFGWVSAFATTTRGATDYMFQTPLELSANTTYFLRLQAMGDSGTDSNFVAFPSPVVTQPTSATNLAFTGLTTTGVTLTWSDVNGNARNGWDTQYSVDLRDSLSGPVIGNVIVTAPFSAGFLGLAVNTTYYAQVTALSRGAAWPDALPASAAAATLAAVPVPAVPAFSGVTDSTITYSWASNGNPPDTNYLVQATTQTGGNFALGVSTSVFLAAPGALTHVFDNLLANSSYWFRVAAMNRNDVASAFLLQGPAVTLARPVTITGFDTVAASIGVHVDNNANGAGTIYELRRDGTTILPFTSAGGPETIYTDAGLGVNRSYGYEVRSIARDGSQGPWSAPVVSTWTRAATPPALLPGPNGPIAMQLQFDTAANTNPNGPPPAARTQYSIQAVDVIPDGLTVQQEGLYLRPTGGDIAVLDSTFPVWATQAQWDANGDTVFLSSGLQPGQFYWWVVYARNGDNGAGPNIPTAPSVRAFTTTKSGQPVVTLYGITATQSLNQPIWINTLDIPFQSRGAFNTYYDLTQSLAPTISNSFGADYYFDKQLFPAPAGRGAHGWSGVYDPMAPTAPIAPAGTPLANPPVDYYGPLSGFRASGEGQWFLYVVGDAYAPSVGYNNHFADQLQGNQFRVFVDVTPPDPTAMNLRAQRSFANPTPIVSGSTTGWVTPYFLWNDPDPGVFPPSQTVSPTAGYSWSFSTNPSVDPIASTDTLVNPNYQAGPNNRAVQMPAQALGTYYFKVRTLDQAGNWSAPTAFTYVCDPDLVPPACNVRFASSVLIPRSNAIVAVSTGDYVTLTFTEPMDISTVNGATVRVLRITDNMAQPLGGTSIPLSITNNGTLMNGATEFYLIPPSGAFQAGYRYEVNTTAGLTDLSGNPLDQQIRTRFYTLMDPAVPNVMVSESSMPVTGLPAATVSFTPNAWGGAHAGLAINEDPGAEAMAAPGVTEGRIANANQSLNRNYKGYGAPIAIHEFNLYNAASARMAGVFNNRVTLSFRYRTAVDPSNGKDYVLLPDGSPSRILPSALAVYWLDEATGVWVRIPGSTVDLANNVVSADVKHFSVYGVLGAPAQDLSAAYAYPVPYKPALHNNGIRFNSLSSIATIKIYTVAGELVKTLHSDDTGGLIVWDPVTNDNGDPLASDVYLYVIENDQQKKTGKLMVVR